MKERAATEHLLNVVMFHEHFLCSAYWSKGQSMTHRIISNSYFNNKRKIMTDSVHKDNVESFKKRQKEKLQGFAFAVHFIAIGDIFLFL